MQLGKSESNSDSRGLMTVILNKAEKKKGKEKPPQEGSCTATLSIMKTSYFSWWYSSDYF